MQANVIGRVKNTNLAKTQGLLPLYEAIINSIDAIEETPGSTPQGKIDITILRQYALSVDVEGQDQQTANAPIRGFIIQDNGIGFTDKNFNSFNEADTQSKATKGGKGVGRFIWLKTFQKIEIDSVFEKDNKLFKREFTFSLATPDGIQDHKIEQLIKPEPIQTVVKLLNFKSEFEERIPRNATIIARRIVEHSLEYLLLGRFPKIILHEEDDSQIIDLEEVYSTLVANVSHEQYKLGKHEFDVAHFKIHIHSDISHQINYCANNRVAKSVKIGNRVPNLSTTLSSDGNEPFVYAGYVSSSFLDEHVNQQRTDFELFPEDGLKIPGELTWQEIENASLKKSESFLMPFTEVIKVEKEDRIREYVNENAPEYRYIIKNHSEELDSIPPDISDDKLDSQLHEIQRKIEQNLRQETETIVEALSSDNTWDENKWDEQFSKFWQEFNEVGKANLAKYIVHRKKMLTILEMALKRQPSGKYSLEEIIHRIIFPLKNTSDDISHNDHNLWIIDEKLSYHQYLASDKPLNKIQPIDSDFDSRPDLLIFFNNAFATVDDEHPYNSGVVIIEFKRPMRDNYSESENPISQVLGYVKQIKEGKSLQKDGRPFQILSSTPFYCYIVCDITPMIRDRADFASLLPTPDANGYFGFFKNLGAYVEVISFDKLLRDAQKRNRVLFDKLELPSR